MEYSDEIMRDYLLGKLDEGFAKQLEADLENNPDLDEALSLQRDVLIGIKAGFDDQLRQKLVADSDGEKTRIRRMPLWRWASAAAIILGSLGVYLYMTQTSLDKRLYAQYFQDFPNIIAPDQRGEEAGEPAFAAYYGERWSVAADAFALLQKAKPTEGYPSFYGALAHMHLEEWDKAISLLEQVRAGNDTRFIDAGTWYVALAYLRDEQPEKAQLILSAIRDGNSSYRVDASQLLDALE